jgi:hypothetical protein
VAGGNNNQASGPYCVVSGGASNNASGSNATIGGGTSNIASNIYCSVFAGFLNTASGLYASAGAGKQNVSSGTLAHVGGGFDNTASGGYAGVLGGYGNAASGLHSAVLGGKLNSAASAYSAVLGGQSNNTGVYTNVFILGSSITATASDTTYVQGLKTAGPVTEGVVAIGNTGTSKTIDLASGTVQTASLTGNCAFTMPTAVAGRSFTLFLTQTGAFSATFASVKWQAGAAPVVTAVNGKIDIFTFVSDGTYWYGTATQNF